jgi:predicted  nucleic acid-binding Zn-ribbon protein
MTDDRADLVLELLRQLRDGQDRLREDVADMKGRLTGVELSVAQVHNDFARQSLRLDRIETRLERIERRLAPPEASS